LYFNEDFVEVTIGKQKRQRSYNQNAYYYGIVIKIIADEIGNDRQYQHYWLRDKFGLKMTIQTEEGAKTY
jgi:hypothetical protein